MTEPAEGYWKKKRNGVEYGSWHTWQGGRIVNLGTPSLEEAKKKAQSLGASVAETIVNSHLGGSETPAAGASSEPRRRRRNFVGTWAAAKPETRTPSASPSPAAPEPPKLSPGMVTLCEGFAHSIARLNAVSVAAMVRLWGNRVPPRPSDEEVEALERTYTEGFKELMILQGMKWWHVLLAQNGALAVRMWDEGAPINNGPQPLRSVTAPTAQ